MNDAIEIIDKKYYNVLKIQKIENITTEWTINPTFTITRETENGMVIDCGKGLDEDAAIASALHESIERYSAENYKNCFVTLSANKLCEEFSVCKPSDFYSSKVLADNLEIDYVKGINLINNEETLVPMECVKFPTYGIFNNNTTIGLASGKTMDNAILHAIYELIEHDTLCINVYSGMPGIDIKLCESDGVLFDIYKSIKNQGIEVELKLLSNINNVPTILALFNSVPAMPGIKIAGMGSNLDVNIAIRRAITECEQSACYWYEKYKVNDMVENDIIHPTLEMLNRYHLTNNSVTTEEFDSYNFYNAEEELKFLINRLSKYTSKIIAVDITSEDLGVPVTRVVIPNFENSLIEEYIKERSKLFEHTIREYVS